MSSRTTVTDAKIDVQMPIVSVTAKPRIGPDPSQNITSAQASVVSCESAMVMKARVKPASMAAIGRLAGAQLLADALVDQHVGVDRHGDAEHQAGDAGQRQRRPGEAHQRDRQQAVHDQADAGEDAEGAVGQDGEDDGGDAADDAGELAGLDGVGAQRRADGALLDDGELGRQRAGAQLDGQLRWRSRP